MGPKLHRFDNVWIYNKRPRVLGTQILSLTCSLCAQNNMYIVVSVPYIQIHTNSLYTWLFHTCHLFKQCTHITSSAQWWGRVLELQSKLRKSHQMTYILKPKFFFVLFYGKPFLSCALFLGKVHQKCYIHSWGPELCPFCSTISHFRDTFVSWKVYWAPPITLICSR